MLFQNYDVFQSLNIVYFIWIFSVCQNIRLLVSRVHKCLLAHLSHWLMVSYCDRWMSVVRRPSSTIASKDIFSLTTGWNLTKLGRNYPYMYLLKIVQMVLVHCISRSRRLKIDF